METSISIPEPIFQAAEQLAQHLNISRSELYTRAVSFYIKEHKKDNIMERLNQIYEKEQENSALNSTLQILQFHSLPQEKW